MLKSNRVTRPLFTLGSVYSTSACKAEQTTETNNSNWPEAKVAENLNSRLPRSRVVEVRVGLAEPGTARLRVRHADHSATLPPGFACTCYTIGLKACVITCVHMFSGALHWLHVMTLSFDRFIVLSVSFVIGCSDYFGFVQYDTQ